MSVSLLSGFLNLRLLSSQPSKTQKPFVVCQAGWRAAAQSNIYKLGWEQKILSWSHDIQWRLVQKKPLHNH